MEDRDREKNGALKIQREVPVCTQVAQKASGILTCI